MKLAIELTGKNKTDLIIERNWFTGSFNYFENNCKHEIKRFLDISTHFNLDLKKQYEFEVVNEEVFKIKIEHIRPLYFSGFRPQKYNVFVNGKLNKAYKGY